MLVLKRKVGEIIRIGDDIELHILAIEGEVIKLGFNAPRNVQIMRSELYDSIRNENVQAVQQKVNPDQLLALLASRQKNNI